MVQKLRLAAPALIASLMATSGCQDLRSTCGEAAVGAPYPAGLPYVGVHANPQNNDLVDCQVPRTWKESWAALQGRGVGQPATLSPGADVVYVTASAPGGDGDCSVFALDEASGEQRWCVAEPWAVGSTVEVDADGRLYLSGEDGLLSLAADGSERWRLTAADGLGSGAVGVHFTPAGHLATVTRDGVVALVSRSSGALLSSLDLPAATGFAALPAGSSGDYVDYVPSSAQGDLEDLFGDTWRDGTFVGRSGKFSDNTVGVAPDGTLYVTGGGPDEDTGAVIQVRVDDGADPPALEVGFHVLLHGASAASPVISPDGLWLKTSDGVYDSLAGGPAYNQLVEIDRCPATGECEPTHLLELPKGPMSGSSPALAGGEHLHWQTTFGGIWDQDVPDLVSHDGDDPRWAIDLPDDMVWTSVITVTEGLVLGTATAFTPDAYQIADFSWPATATSELIALDRATGELVFRTALTDDSSASVTVGPDGSLYVGLLALLSCLATDTRPVGGIVKLEPSRS